MLARSALVSYQEKLEQERNVYAHVEMVHELPGIFHYWSNRYLRPKLESLGFSSPENLFYSQALEALRDRDGEELRILSVGAGNCDLEIGILQGLRTEGARDLRCDCIELNPDMIERGRQAADSKKLSSSLRFIEGDFNDWRANGECYHLIIANQSLHHVLALEHLLGELRKSLSPTGRLVVSDMIGRNGHRRWPEALEAIWSFWRELPPAYRYNHIWRTYEDLYVDRDCSQVGFEGVRAQDILPLLLRNFHFEIFLPFGNLVDPFLDRAFGPNFDAEDEWDRDLIDRIHARDEAGIQQGEWPPTHLLAVLRASSVGAMAAWGGLSPEQCIRRGGKLSATPPTTSHTRSPRVEDLPPLIEVCRRLSVDLAAERERVQDLWAEWRERTDWALRLEEELKEERAHRIRLEVECQKLSAWGAQLDREIEAKDAAHAQLQSEFEQRTQWALSLDAELKRAYQWGEDLSRHLRAFEWAQALERRLPRLTKFLKVLANRA
jgi:SAM-dependent methyltransferase